jgi:hypothetical protein
MNNSSANDKNACCRRLELENSLLRQECDFLKKQLTELKKEFFENSNIPDSSEQDEFNMTDLPSFIDESQPTDADDSGIQMTPNSKDVEKNLSTMESRRVSDRFRSQIQSDLNAESSSTKMRLKNQPNLGYPPIKRRYSTEPSKSTKKYKIRHFDVRTMPLTDLVKDVVRDFEFDVATPKQLHSSQSEVQVYKTKSFTDTPGPSGLQSRSCEFLSQPSGSRRSDGGTSSTAQANSAKNSFFDEKIPEKSQQHSRKSEDSSLKITEIKLESDYWDEDEIEIVGGEFVISFFLNLQLHLFLFSRGINPSTKSNIEIIRKTSSKIQSS